MNALNNTTPPKKENISRVTKRQLDRRALVLLEIIKGHSNSYIANKLKISRFTVNLDVQTMIGDVIDWTNNLALVGWMKKVEEIYIYTNESIAHIMNLQAKIRESVDASKFEWDPNPFDPKQQAQDYLKFENIKTKAYSAFMTKINQYSEYAQLENAKTKTIELLIGMTTHIPLFAATQRLAIFYDQNKPKELEAKLDTFKTK